MDEQEKLNKLIELASILSRQSDFHEVLRLVTQKAFGLMNAEIALILMINPSTRQTIKTFYKAGKEVGDGKYQVIHNYLSGWVISNKIGFFSEDIQNDSRFRKSLFKGLPLKSVMCSPLWTENIIIGTLLLLNKRDGKNFNEKDFLFLEE